MRGRGTPQGRVRRRGHSPCRGEWEGDSPGQGLEVVIGPDLLEAVTAGKGAGGELGRGSLWSPTSSLSRGAHLAGQGSMLHSFSLGVGRTFSG